MKSYALIATLILSLPSFTKGETNGVVVEKLVRLLPKLSAVESSSVGFGGTEGAFYSLSRHLLKHGNEEEFRTWADDTNSMVKCMGLYCLAASNSDSSENYLKADLSNPSEIEYAPGGCDYFDVSIGRFCWELLKDPKHMGHQDVDSSPSLSEDELFRLGIRIIAEDSTCHIHYPVDRFIYSFQKEHGDNFIKPYLEPALKEDAITTLKAAGRLEYLSNRVPLLKESLENEKLSNMARMAAASSLTRFATEEIVEYLATQTALLNSLEPGFALKILGDAEVASGHIRSMEPMYKIRTWHGRLAVSHDLYQIYSTTHPIAFEDLKSHLFKAHIKDSLDTVAVESLKTMAENHADYSQSWNTYSSTPYEMSYFLSRYIRMERYKGRVSLEDLLTIQKILDPIVNKQDTAPLF